MIEARGLTKRYGPKTAVDGISFTVRPGTVTGFLGPNGAGKSTTMRMIMGLDRPTAGTVTVNGRPYAQHRSPLTEVGALLDAKAVHTGRTAYNHLLAMAATHGIPTKRVDEVIEMTGLQSVAKKRVGGFSLGMGQRLGIASALLGDPKTLILDEPVNGLDPEGVLWVRNLAKYLASEGRTVFLSSHLMSEVALTADHIVVIGKGRIIADAPVGDIVNGTQQRTVRVRTPHATQLAELLTRDGATITSDEPSLLVVSGADAAGIGELAAAQGFVLHELTPVTSTLEDAYMALTADAVEYQTESAQAHVGHGAAGAPAQSFEGAQR
ncbi:ABC transporter ATP-binding protein [Cellulosimicrobium sp. NPDC057127]|uniref:ABC transporter ATP-binding protein n=1 Tax=Cellulosimicrobium sp. NPDC057127 TaxID=3346026 RepID=UPI003633CC3B